MSALLAALALFAAQDAGAAAQAPTVLAQASEPAPDAGPPYPVGAPRDDYGLVTWCYGALRGWLDLHDQVMPEVRRIETTYRRPGAKLSDDLKVYDDLQREGQKNAKLFERAIQAAERASIKPIAPIGAESLKKGRATWAAAPNLQPARLAQEWMSWALPARCLTTAESLEARARLLGTAFEIETQPQPAPAAPVVDAPAETPPPG